MGKKGYVVSYNSNGKRRRSRIVFDSKKQAQEFIQAGRSVKSKITAEGANPRIVNANSAELWYRDEMKLIDKVKVGRRR